MKNLILALIAVLTCIPICMVDANILYVPGTYPTIQSAINSAVNGDTILVAPGVYYENVNFRGKGVLLSSYFLTNHDTSYISSTVINGSTPVYPDTASCVLMTNPSTSSAGDTSAALVGFTLTGGRGIVWNDIYYPGYLYREGGGLFIQNWSPRIRFNRILLNNIMDTLHPGGGGGGIRCCNSNPVIENNVIQYNFAYCGMAISFYHASGIIRNNIIAGNYGASVWNGGVIYTYQNYLTNPIIIENNTIVNNTAVNGCAGVRLYSSNNVTVKNNIIWGNLPSQIYITGSNYTISHCDIQGGWSGIGNIDVNPQFITNSYYLSSASLCIDAGDSSVSYNDPEDPSHLGFALWPALGTLRNDMGAFGGPHSTIIGSSTVGIKEYGNNQVISKFMLYQNYPNPFNPSTKIKFDLPKSNLTLSEAKGLLVRLAVYDILGREITVLVNEQLKPGTYEVEWDGSNYSSGVYYYKLVATDYKETRRMVLVK